MTQTATPEGIFTWYELMTNDLDAAIRFYSGVTGWEVRDSGMPGMRYMLFSKNGRDAGGMMSWTAMGGPRPPRWLAHLSVKDVDRTTARVLEAGGTQHRAPTNIPGVGRFSVVADPQGAEVMLFHPKEPMPRPSTEGPGVAGWHELSTTDWQAAWAFYSSLFPWTKETAIEMGPMGTYQTFHLGANQRGGMMSFPPGSGGENAQPAWLFYFVVDDIQAAAQRVRDHGGAVQHGPVEVPGGGWILQGTDDQGCRFALTAAH